MRLLTAGFFLVFSLVAPALADIATCSATATDASGNVQPWACPHFSDFVSTSHITAGASGLSVELENYVFGSIFAPGGLTIDYQGELATSSSTGEIVITGGAGSGQLMGTFNTDAFAFFDHSSAQEQYVSNIAFPLPRASFQVVIPFMYDVPFDLTISDDIKFSGTVTDLRPDSSIEDLTQVDGTLGIYDSNGSPATQAKISQVSTPEVSSLPLLLTVLLGVGLSFKVRRRPI